jgi:translocation and assembly module TamB
LLVVLLVLVGGLLGTLWWLAHSPDATVWLLSRVPGLKVTAPKGTLIGDFSATAAELTLPGSGTVRIDDLAWRGLRIERAAPGWNLRIAVDRLRAAQVAWQGASDGKPGPAQPPDDLRIPVEIAIAAVSIGEIRIGGADATPVLDLQGGLHLGAERGSVHRIDKATLSWGRVRFSASGQIATEAPLQLEAHVDATQNAGSGSAAWSASVNAAGPLAAPLVQATVRATAIEDRPVQALDARATVRPFESWPLGDLELSAKSLDLSAFHPDLPVTAFSGTAVARTRGSDQPGMLTAELSNGSPGRWDEGRLPLHALSIDLRALPNDLRTMNLQAFTAELGSRERSAGQVVGRGGLNGERWNVELTLADVRPALLDSRAPPMTLGGRVALQAALPTAAASAPPIDIRAALQGRLAERGPARSVELNVDGSVAAQRIEVRRAEGRASGAVAELAGTATRDSAEAPWHLQGHLNLDEFDPAAWWPGPDGSAWRKGPHRLNARSRFDVRTPTTIGALPWQQALAAVRGSADIDLADSRLAGVPLQGSASWRNEGGTAALAKAALTADGNRVKFDGRIGLDTVGAGDAWDASVAAPALARLAPLWRLFVAASPAAAGTTPPSGAVSASARVDGRWPALATHGQLEAAGLRFGNASVQKAEARWQLGTTAQAPIELQATARRASFGETVLAALDLNLNGTAQSHAIELRAQTQAELPEWTDKLRGSTAAPAAPGAAASAAGASRSQAADGAASARGAGAAAPDRTTTSASPAASAPPVAPEAVVVSPSPEPPAKSIVSLQARGSLVGSPTRQLSGWRGIVQQVEWRSTAADAGTWLRARDVGIETLWTGGPARVSLEPGRAEVLGASLRWSRFAWQAGDGERVPMRLDARAELDPLRIAPLLRRLQPDFGWGGDLTIAGHVDVQSAPAVKADIVIERKAGDLTVTDELGTQALGLTDLRFGLAAADGVWNFTQALAGTTLGVGAGAIVARTPRGATWPTAATPIEGVVELQVANLGTWGPWVPAGWRLGGALHLAASLSGRLGAPEYTGELSGQALSVRNFLQGVAIGDGEMKILLQGERARVERFTAQAGGGSIALTGGASFGEAPRADVRLTAERFQVLGRVDRRVVASGAAQLRLDRASTRVDGAFTIDEGLIDFSHSDAPSLDDDVQVVRRPTNAPAPAAAAAAAAAPPPPAALPNDGRQLALDLRVDMGERLRIRGRGLDSGLRGELRITSPANRLAVNGTIYTVDGTYAAYGQKLTIDRGQLTFNGAVENPRLDIEATRPNLDIRVGVAVTGTALIPRVRLFSEPELSEMDKLSWLVLGRASDGLGRADTALLQRAALALLAGEGGGSGKLTKAIGIDDVSVSKGEGDVRDTIVSLGKQLSQRWYVGYARGLNATAGSWQLIYRIAQRFTLRAQSGGDNSLDLIWSWRWQ